MPKTRYEPFRPLDSARLALNYLTSMVDERHDYLPYWLVAPHEYPAWAMHCRVDDAELVASWYEAIDAVRGMLETDEGAEVQAGFRHHLMKSWGSHGLRFHEPYPWAATIHSSFHEMAYILSALNRILRKEPDDLAAERRASALVRGMRSLVIERKVKTFWSGDYEEEEPVYEFPNDVYLARGGFDLARHTGRGERPIRNAMMLEALVTRYEQAGDEVALDLARGLANHLLGVSRYFNYRMAFFGHVHSAVWFASGLARMGRLTGEQRYVRKAKGIYDYVRSISSSFGWVPEFAQWQPPDGRFCETCCIKDMIQCGLDLVDAGYEQCWDDVNRFARNQLVENQIASGEFVAVDPDRPDTEATTYRDIDRRIVGGFSGGSEPNSISLERFRSVAGCCAGTAPQALAMVWDRAVDEGRGRITVNLPIDKATRRGEVEMGYPNEGYVAVTPRRKADVAIRMFPWMGRRAEGYVGGRPLGFDREGDLAVFRGVTAGSRVELRHPLRTRRTKERVRGKLFTVLWRGPDVVDLMPRGKPLRLYQREEGSPKRYPKAGRRFPAGKGFEARPTEQAD